MRRFVELNTRCVTMKCRSWVEKRVECTGFTLNEFVQLRNACVCAKAFSFESRRRCCFTGKEGVCFKRLCAVAFRGISLARGSGVDYIVARKLRK